MLVMIEELALRILINRLSTCRTKRFAMARRLSVLRNNQQTNKQLQLYKSIQIGRMQIETK